MKRLWVTTALLIPALVGFTGQRDTYAVDNTQFQVELDGFHQVPPVLTTGTGTFSGFIHADGSISFVLTYSGLTANPPAADCQPGCNSTSTRKVQFADVHFGQEQNTGGILFFLCSNQATAPTQANPVFLTGQTGTAAQGGSLTGTETLFNGSISVPAFGTSLQACPDEGTVTGTIAAADIVDVGKPGNRGAQGILPGELEKARQALISGQTYVQVHTNAYPAGELRRQIITGDRRFPFPVGN